MKKFYSIYLLILLSVVTSCKKDQPVKTGNAPENKPPIIENVLDSVSYTIDGKTYTSGVKTYNNSSTGNEQVSQKIVYIKNSTEYKFVGDPDSVLYYRTNIISSDNAWMSISVLKRFNKLDTKMGFLLYPQFDEVLKFYAVGKHPYAEDFHRENSQDGVALSLKAGGKTYYSYSYYDFDRLQPSKLKSGFQKASTFEIISLTKTTTLGYNLEARFSAVVAEDGTEGQKKVENGYLRLHIDLDPELYPIF